MKTVVAVLAAGLSRRFGRPKQLVDFRGLPLIRHATLTALGAGCDETIVIGSFPEALDGLPVTMLENPDAAEGMSSSIRLAVRYADGARILLTLCDQPLVGSEHLRALVATNAEIAATAYAGTVGVPAIFAPRFANELLALRGDTGARAVIHAHRDEVIALEYEAAAIDIDTASDYEKL